MVLSHLKTKLVTVGFDLDPQVMTGAFYLRRERPMGIGDVSIGPRREVSNGLGDIDLQFSKVLPRVSIMSRQHLVPYGYDLYCFLMDKAIARWWPRNVVCLSRKYISCRPGPFSLDNVLRDHQWG